jgi:hypothetical protein
LWLKLPKERRKRAERSKAALEIYLISHFSVFAVKKAVAITQQRLHRLRTATRLMP